MRARRGIPDAHRSATCMCALVQVALNARWALTAFPLVCLALGLLPSTTLSVSCLHFPFGAWIHSLRRALKSPRGLLCSRCHLWGLSVALNPATASSSRALQGYLARLICHSQSCYRDVWRLGLKYPFNVLFQLRSCLDLALHPRICLHIQDISLSCVVTPSIHPSSQAPHHGRRQA